MTICAAIVGVSYAAPKLLTCLCSNQSNNSLSPCFINQLRAKMAFLSERIKNSLGRRFQFAVTVVLDNAWISSLALCYLTGGKNPFTSLDKGLDVSAAFLGFCIISEFARLVFVKTFPTMNPFFGTRSSNN